MRRFLENDPGRPGVSGSMAEKCAWQLMMLSRTGMSAVYGRRSDCMRSSLVLVTKGSSWWGSTSARPQDGKCLAQERTLPRRRLALNMPALQMTSWASVP